MALGRQYLHACWLFCGICEDLTSSTARIHPGPEALGRLAVRVGLRSGHNSVCVLRESLRNLSTPKVRAVHRVEC